MNNKKKSYLFYCFLLILFLLNILPIQAQETILEPRYLNKIVLCHDIEENEPVYESTSFYTWDEKVVCWINFNYSSGTDSTITWEWEDPNGNIYHKGDTEIEAGNYQNYRIWYWIGIRDKYALNLPGTWKARVYIDGLLLAEKDFTIR